jgi:hypothetical protein
MGYSAQKQEKKSQPKKQAQTAQHAAQPAHAAGGGASAKRASTATHRVQDNNPNGPAVMAGNNAQKNKKNETSTAVNRGQTGKPAQSSNAADESQKGKKNQTKAERQTAKGEQPTQRMLAKLREHASRTKLRLFRGRTQRKGSSLRTRRLSHTTSIFQNSRIRQRHLR